MKRVLEAIAGAGKAGAEVLKDQRSAERVHLAGLLRNFQTLKKSLENRLLDGITDFRRFNLQALLADVDRMIAETEAAIQKATAAEMNAAADRGQSAVDQPMKAAGLMFAPALPGLDADLVDTAFGNTVDLLTPPMKQFGADVKGGLRRVALAGDNRFEEIQRLRDKISGQGFDNAQYRAERIIRTEVGRVFNQAQYERMTALAKTFPFLRKGWRSTRDTRTRLGHREAGATYARGQGIPVADLFTINVYDERPGKGGKKTGTATMRFPLDPNAQPAGQIAASATIMCRCNGFVDFSPQELSTYNRQRVNQALGVGTTPPPVTVTPPPIPPPVPVPKPKRLKPKPAPKPPVMKPAPAATAAFDPDNPEHVRAKFKELGTSPAAETIRRLEAEIKVLQERTNNELGFVASSNLSKALIDKYLKAQGFVYNPASGWSGYGTPEWQRASLAAQAGRDNDPEWIAFTTARQQARDALSKAYAEAQAARTALQAQARYYLMVEQAKRIAMSATFGGRTGSSKEIRDGLDFFQKVVALKNPGAAVEFLSAKGGRGSYHGGTKGTTFVRQDVGNVAHELGHWLEDKVGGVHEQAVAFLVRRTAGESSLALSRLTGIRQYKSWERATGDKFLNAYSGKWYPRSRNIRGLGEVAVPTQKDLLFYLDATEVVSMGLQNFYEDPIRFAETDPDYFDFIFKLVRGTSTEALPANPWEWNHVDNVKKVPDPKTGKIPPLVKTQKYVPPGAKP